jgi:hypothetical protein
MFIVFFRTVSPKKKKRYKNINFNQIVELVAVDCDCFCIKIFPLYYTHIIWITTVRFIEQSDLKFGNLILF